MLKILSVVSIDQKRLHFFIRYSEMLFLCITGASTHQLSNLLLFDGNNVQKNKQKEYTYFIKFFVFVCMCVHVCECGYVHIMAHVWRPEDSHRFQTSPSTFLNRDCCSHCVTLSWSTCFIGVLRLPSCYRKTAHTHTTTSGFVWVPGI